MMERVTGRSMVRDISVMALVRASCLMSTIVTGKPARAQTWAMPLPICPAPMTPTDSISGGSVTIGAMPPAGLTSTFMSGALQFCCQLRQRGEQISHQAVVGDLEDGRFLILIDRHDDLAVLHAGEVLDGPRDPDSDVQFRRDDLTRLPNLKLVGNEACIHRGARGADSGTELVRDRFEQREVITILHPAATRNDNPGSGQLRPLTLGQLGGDEFGEAGQVASRNGFNRGGPTFGRDRVETGGADGDD